MSQNISSAVMQQRRHPIDSLDFFPTPPWATRALCVDVLGPYLHAANEPTVWEPAAGEGHMAEVLRDYFTQTHASDVHDYGRGYPRGTFVGEGVDRAECPFVPDWVITNPPFNLAIDFLERGLDVARIGVALLVRTAWLEGADRFERVFSWRPPTIVAQFACRVPMVKGRWDPAASSATAYAWLVWIKGETLSRMMWIPPDVKFRHTRDDDVARFAACEEAA